MRGVLSDQELLARLVAFNTVSSETNLPLIDFLSEYLDHPRITLNRQLDETGTKANLVAFVDCDDNSARQGLTLSGHVDVVPADEPEWRSAPFRLTETSEAFFGRGTCDMKGFVALAVNLLRDRASDSKAATPMALLLTYDEEVGSFGAAALAKTFTGMKHIPRATIVGEPTSLRLVRMHKGHVKIRFSFTGRSAHSGYPHLGINAIEPAAHLVGALCTLRNTLQAERSETSPFFPETPFVALNIARIQGGDAINVVPAHCTVEIGLRPLPGMDVDDVVDRVRDAVDGAPKIGDFNMEIIHTNPPMLLPEDSSTYRRFSEVLAQDESLGVSYASDAGVFQSMGLECVLLGPGNIEVAHKPNEFLPKDEFAAARVKLAQIIEAFATEA